MPTVSMSRRVAKGNVCGTKMMYSWCYFSSEPLQITSPLNKICISGCAQLRGHVVLREPCGI
eukprot:4155505-Prorocentrum_lima.AAC.1